jgi:hypothetical protein
MAVPTLASVTPNDGHSGGRTLVQLVGTNFKLPNPPPVFGPAPAPPPSVRVKFGGREATDVKVWSATSLYCTTPDHDELQVLTAWTSVDPATDTFTLVAHGLANATPVRLEETAGALPAGLRNDVAYYVVGAAANTFQLSLTVGGPAVDVTGTGSGRAVSIGAHDVVVENVDDDGALVPGETATLAKAFTFRRPDLSEESELARVVRAMLRMLKRQVLENVQFVTHTDFDPTTGDQLSLANVQKLPAIVLANFEMVDDPAYPDAIRNDFPADAGRFIERRPPAVVMVKYDLIGVSDDPLEILNLVQVVRLFFAKNVFLFVDRSASDPSLGQVRYDLEWSAAGPVSVSHAGDNSNVESFGGEVRIRGVLLEDIPGVSQAKIPGIPARYPHESTTAYGHVSADDASALELSTGKRPET